MSASRHKYRLIGACQALLILFLAMSPPPAFARQDVSIGIGYGIAFLPIYLCQELNLVEKHARAAGLDVKASYPRFYGSGPMQEAMLSRAIDIAPYGLAPFLIARERALGTPQQAFAISGLTSLPLALVTSRPGVRSVKDLTPSDRIAMPSSASPQMFVLQMESEKVFGPGQQDKLRTQVVVLPHYESINDLVSGSSEVTAYFSSPPFTQVALQNRRIHTVFTSVDVMGQSSFLILGATKRYVETNPQIPDVIANAMQEAADLIKSDPRRAAEIYLKYEPSKTLDVAMIAAVLRELQDDFGKSVHGLQAYADFMGELGQLNSPPKSWKEVVTPSIARTPSS